MDELILEPYAAQIIFHHWETLPANTWTSLLTRFMQDLAGQCNDSKNCVIGHIKALALFSNRQYLSISAVCSDRPPDMDGILPQGTQKLRLTLNVVVYGISRLRLQEIVEIAITRLRPDFRGNIAIRSLTSGIISHP